MQSEAGFDTRFHIRRPSEPTSGTSGKWTFQLEEKNLQGRYPLMGYIVCVDFWHTVICYPGVKIFSKNLKITHFYLLVP